MFAGVDRQKERVSLYCPYGFSLFYHCHTKQKDPTDIRKYYLMKPCFHSNVLPIFRVAVSEYTKCINSLYTNATALSL